MRSQLVIKMAEERGWVLDRVKGSHHVFKHPDRKGILVIPHPKKELPKGTLNAILKAMGD